LIESYACRTFLPIRLLRLVLPRFYVNNLLPNFKQSKAKKRSVYVSMIGGPSEKLGKTKSYDGNQILTRKTDYLKFVVATLSCDCRPLICFVHVALSSVM